MMSIFTLLAAATFLQPALASGTGPGSARFQNLVTFGDSYTDIVSVGDGGTAWPVYAVGYANATLFPFARSGAPCSQDLTPRPFPAVVQDELPLYFAEVANGSIHISADDTLYTLWIGTNDLGPNTLLTGGQNPGVTVLDVTSCAVGWVNTLYQHGARNFLLQNVNDCGSSMMGIS